MTAQPSQPKKDVIYVDIEDDITSIIDKVKHAPSQIIALVPPKRIGALQSVVNLKLLQRAAESSDKRLVLITNDHALSSLAAGAAIPIARNLQSKPEIPQIAPLHSDPEEVIEGDAVAPSEDTTDTDDGDATPVAAAAASSAKPSRMSRIPNFDAFRNKAALIIAAVVGLTVFFVWALLFAPKAEVTVTANTIPYSVNTPLSATPEARLDAQNGTLPIVIKEIKRSASVDFTATGKKDVGERATGTVEISINWGSNRSGASIPAGTTVTSVSGLTFTTNQAVSFTLGDFVASRDTKTTGVTATASGTRFNGANGSVSGLPSGTSGEFSDPTAGGTDKTITVVSEQDAAAAREKLPAQPTEELKAELQKQFTNDSIVVSESFSATPGAPVVTPAVGEEASAGKLTVETTYTLAGFKRTDISALLEADLKRQIEGVPNQSIYDKGIDAVRFSNFRKEGEEYRVSLQSTGYIGPEIDTGELANRLVGKREGEIIAEVKTYDGIESVAVDFSPFWVSRAPDANKIIIQFQIDNAGD